MAGLMEKDYGVGWFDAPEQAPAAPGYGSYLSLPGSQPVAPQAEKLDPTRMMWAGTLMDIGNAFGNALAGTGASQGNAMRLYGHARDYNNSLDQQARERAEALRQQKIEAEDRALQRRLIESRIGKYEADASATPRPKPIGSPQRMADGTLAQTVQMPDGSITMEPLGDFANEGRVVTVAGVPYFLDARSNQLFDLGQGAGGDQRQPEPQADSQQQGSDAGGNSRQQPFTAEGVAEDEANRQAAIDRAKAEAKKEFEREQKIPEWQQQLADMETQIANINDLKKNIDEVGFGMLEGRFTGGMPFVGSEYDDLFDSIASSQVLKNAQQMTGVLSESDIALIRSMGLDRTRGKEFNERQMNQLIDVYQRAAQSLREKLGVESGETDDDLVNKYLD